MAISYSLADSASGKFAINASTGVVSTAQSNITAGSYNITVRATDSAGWVKDTVFAITVTASGGGGGTITLATLTLSPLTATAASAYSGTISNVSSGSTVTATSSDGTTLTVTGTGTTRTVSGTFSAAGTKTITLVETLAGAVGSPKTTGSISLVVSAAPSSFVPTDLTGLYAWYDATDTASLTLQDDASTSGQVGNEVYNWANKKSGGPALTQVGNGLHPIYQAASFNGKAALQVGGAPLKLDGTIAINSSTFWWFVAIKSLADTEQGAILSFAGASGTDFSSANGFLFFFDDTAGGVRLYHNSGAVDIASAAKAFNNGVAGVVGAVADGSQAKLYVDGTSVGSASFSGTPNMTQVRIGASAAADAQHLSSALIGEVLIGTGTLTTQNITDINAYLAAKWTA